MSIYSVMVAKLRTAGFTQIQETGKTYLPKAGVPYIRPTLFNAESLPGSLGANGFQKRISVLQVDLFKTLGIGDDEANAQKIVDLFDYKKPPLSVGAQKLRVTKSWIANTRELDGWLVTSVMVRCELGDVLLPNDN